MNNIEFVEFVTHSDYAQKMAKTYLPPKKLFDKRVSLSAKYKRKYKIFAGFKAFDNDMTCLDFKYEEGALYIYSKPGKIQLCARGFHFCPEPLDVFSHYPMKLDTKVAFVYALVEESIYSGSLERRYDNGNFCEDVPAKNPKKLCATAIYIAHVLSHEEIVDCINRRNGHEINSTGTAPYDPVHVDFYKKGIDDSRCTVCSRVLAWGGFRYFYGIRDDPDRIRNWEGYPVCARCCRRMGRKALEHASIDRREKRSKNNHAL